MCWEARVAQGCQLVTLSMFFECRVDIFPLAQNTNPDTSHMLNKHVHNICDLRTLEKVPSDFGTKKIFS